MTAPAAEVIFDAAKRGDTAFFKALDPATDLQIVDRGWGFTPLGWACWHAQPETALAILERFAVDVNYVAEGLHGSLATPLVLACEIEHHLALDDPEAVQRAQLPLIDALIARGADLHYREGATGQTAYSRALFRRRWIIADHLEKKGAGPGDHYYATHYYRRCAMGPLEMILDDGSSRWSDLEQIGELIRRGAKPANRWALRWFYLNARRNLVEDIEKLQWDDEPIRGLDQAWEKICAAFPAVALKNNIPGAPC